MWPSGRPTNHCIVVLVKIHMNILQCIAFVPPKIIIWALNVVRWLSRSSTPVKTILGVMKLAGMTVSIIACENGLGWALSWAIGPRSPTERSSIRCRLLCNFSLVLRNSSLLAQDASISAINWSCLSSCSTRTSAMSLSCSALDVAIASYRALTISTSYYMVGLSFPSDPNGPSLVFLITSRNLSTNAGGIWFYRAPRWTPNVLAGWPTRRLSMMTSSSSTFFFSNLFYLLLLWSVAPLKQRGSYLLMHSDDQVSTRLIRNKN